LSNLGLAASAPASAMSSPAPLTKSKWKGKKPLTIGTNRTPPPTPPRTPTIPIKKLTINSDSGQTHHATELDPCCELSANAGRERHIKNMKIKNVLRECGIEDYVVNINCLSNNYKLTL